jgi:hypothetical protein
MPNYAAYGTNLLLNWQANFGTFADVLGVVSFGISVYLAYRIGEISKNFQDRILVRHCGSRLNAILRNLIEAVSNSRWDGVRREVSRSDVYIQHLAKLPKGDLQSRAAEAIALIKTVASGDQTDVMTNAERCISAIAALTASIELFGKDKEWERK